MQEILINKLLEYIRDNNPDILFALEAEATVTIWLSEKVSAVDTLIIQLKEQQQPDYEIEETCMDIITKDLRPSKYNYICNLLEEEFQQHYQQLLQTGLLQHEVINMIHHCQSTFDDLKFSEETEDNQFLRYAIIGAVSDYLNSENENVSNELQQPTKTAG
ncbi:MAG: DUF1896 family protein [Chitinophagaceae bacterium]